MSRKYELKLVDREVWEQTPETIQKKVMRFNNLQKWIRGRKGKIERMKTKINELKVERKKWEKERTELYNELISFQNEYIPSVSSTTQSGNNFQWSINLKIGNIRRKKYLGSNIRVREKLDEIKDLELFQSAMEKRNDLTTECKKEIDRIIQRNLAKEMEKDLEGVVKKWENDELKMWDYFF